MKVTREIFQVGGGQMTSAEDAAVYLISFGEHAALVDAGCGRSTRRLLTNIKACGTAPEQIEFLLITHCHFDHTGGINALRNNLPLRVVAHRLDAEYLERGDSEVTAASWYGAVMEPVAVDIKLEGPREEITLGERTIQAIHVPGHSPGSVAYLAESEGLKVLFGQDIHGPLHPSLLSDRREYLRSLDLLLSLEADILCEGHYGVFKGKRETASFIRQFMRA